jgi:hypothetical protein
MQLEVDGVHLTFVAFVVVIKDHFENAIGHGVDHSHGFFVIVVGIHGLTVSGNQCTNQIISCDPLRSVAHFSGFVINARQQQIIITIAKAVMIVPTSLIVILEHLAQDDFDLALHFMGVVLRRLAPAAIHQYSDGAHFEIFVDVIACGPATERFNVFASVCPA